MTRLSTAVAPSGLMGSRAGGACSVVPLVGAIQDLSLAHDLPAIVDIVRTAARVLTGADGATVVLRDGDLCHYVDEEAIAPLWKGQRFPLCTCISGWVMLHHQAVAIEDVFADPRVPAEAYAPTFVKSLAMVPIRTSSPIGAIGNYWASPHLPTPEDVELLQALADSTSIALENVEVWARLARVSADRDAIAEQARRQEALSVLAVHDLKTPATAISLAASLRLRAPDLSETERRCWARVLSSADVIHRTTLDLLDAARIRGGKLSPRLAAIDLGELFAGVREVLRPLAEARGQSIDLHADISPGALLADADLLRRVLQNLLDNALRHGGQGCAVRLEARKAEAFVEITVADDGPGVAPAVRDCIFDRFVTFGGGGHGLGLTFCRLAVEAHGGTIAVEDNEPQGARFRVRLPCGGPA